MSRAARIAVKNSTTCFHKVQNNTVQNEQRSLVFTYTLYLILLMLFAVKRITYHLEIPAFC